MTMKLEDCPVEMEIDTGAALSLVSEATFKKLWKEKPALAPTQVRLCFYSGQPIPVVGSVKVNVVYKQQSARLPLLVVQGDGPSLLGRNWLSQLKLDWQEIHHLSTTPLQTFLDKYDSVFQEGLGTLKDFKARIYVDPEAKPRYCKARSVPYAMRQMVEDKLARLVEEGTLEPVQFASWAAPILPVLKADKSSVCICGDFRQTINPVLKLDRYPIPKIEDLFATLSKGKSFTKLDLSQAYQQLPLEEESKQFVVINTTKGLFRYNRLPFGISSAPGIFQRVTENVLKGIPRVMAYIDNILLTGLTKEAHLQTLEEVLKRLERTGLKAKMNKSQFMESSVSYLGHRIDAEGLHPLPDKVQAIVDALDPQNVQELKSYLGLLSYYGKFSSVLAPLYRLLRKDYWWRWSAVKRAAFKSSKELLTSSKLLVHYDLHLDLVLACDASAYGVGAVLAHHLLDGTERPIGYASRSLSLSEQNYSQLEKEGLSCVVGVKKFHSYLFSRLFELVTDNKPLLALLSEHRGTSLQASARIRRWSLLLSMYEYTLKFRRTEAHGNADALSRLPLPVAPPKTETPPELVLLMEHLEDSPVTADQIRVWTRRDPSLSSVVQCLRQGWPTQSSPELHPFWSKKSELSLYHGNILCGSRVVVPVQGRAAVLQELHEGHPGMTKMKALARMYVWWPWMENDDETTVRTCAECQTVRAASPVAPLHPWKWPTRPWARLHLDYAGPFLGKMFLVLIDAHSKWIEAICTLSATSDMVIQELRTLFAQFGLPETIVTDNGSCFVSEEFETFLKENGIMHITSAPYHPSTNGLAERAVQVLN